MDHLACFAAGMYGLAAHEEKDEKSERWMEIAKVKYLRIFEANENIQIMEIAKVKYLRIFFKADMNIQIHLSHRG